MSHVNLQEAPVEGGRDAYRVSHEMMSHVNLQEASGEGGCESYRVSREMMSHVNLQEASGEGGCESYRVSREMMSHVLCRKRLAKVEVSPAERWSNIQKKLKQARKEPGPCGGFSATYCCMCDYHVLPFMEDVAWVGPCLLVFPRLCFHNALWYNTVVE